MEYAKYIFVILVLTTFTAFAQKDYTNDPGYFDFGDLSMFENSEGVTEVFLESNILKMVASATEEKEPDLSSMLNGLKLVKVNVFNVSDKNENSIRERINEADKKLVDQKWERIVRTKGGDEIVNVYIKTSGNSNILGLVITTLDKHDQAVFVNIVGNIDLKKIGKLGAKFDIPSLDKIDKK